MRRVVVRVVELLLVCGILAAGFLLFQELREQRELKERVQELSDQFTGKTPVPEKIVETVEVMEEDPVITEYPQTEEEEKESVVLNIAADFPSLKEVNPEIVGWIRVPGTTIDQPILQATDNNKYLRADFNGNYSRYGSVFMDYHVQLPDSKGFIMYGHNMGKGKTVMFSELLNYKSKDYCYENPEIYFAVDDGTRIGREGVWKVFSVVDVDCTKKVVVENYYQSAFDSDAAYNTNIRNLYRASLYETGESGIPESFIALSTCSHSSGSGNMRLVVYAGLFPEYQAGS